MSGKWGSLKNTTMIVATAPWRSSRRKLESGGKEIEEKPKEKKKPSTKVIDLIAVLQESLAKSKGARKKPAPKRATKQHAKKAA